MPRAGILRSLRKTVPTGFKKGCPGKTLCYDGGMKTACIGRPSKSLAVALRNFAVLNLCALLPAFWTVLGWMPDQVKVLMRGREEAPGAVVADGNAIGGMPYGTWSGGNKFRFFLPATAEWRDLSFRLPGASGAEAVERIELEKWKILSLGKSGRGLVECGEGTGEWAFVNPRFERVGFVSAKIAAGLLLLEVLLAGLSWVCAGRRHDGAWRPLAAPAMAVALALALLTQVALPVQSFWANRLSYPFSGGELAAAVAWRFVLTWVLSGGSLILLARCFGRRVFGAAFALAVCLYLESGILSNGLASLNGDIYLLEDRTRALWDAAVWGAVFAVVLGAHPVLRNRYVLASFCLLGMVGASMLDTRHEKPADRSRLAVRDFSPIETVIRSVSFSTNRNVLVFVVDSLEREQAHAVMEDPEDGPGLRERFRGFTEYTNNVGALPQTLSAMPNMLTGRYPDGTENLTDYFWSCYGPDSVVRAFLDDGQDVFVTTTALGCGYASRPTAVPATASRKLSVLERPGNEGGTWSIRDFVRWRCFPFAGKAFCSVRTGFRYNTNRLREWGVYPELAKADTAPGCPGTFLCLHTEGVHVPSLWNRRGELLAEPDYGDRGCVEQGLCIMHHLGNLMDAFRRKGIYDRSLILVLADHGRHQEEQFLKDRAAGRLPGNARPFLWIKPPCSTHDFQSSGLPSSHAKIAEILTASVRGNLTDGEIDAILRTDSRVYRRIAMLGAGWTDWVVDADGKFSIEEHGQDPSARGKARPVKCGHRYSLAWNRMKDLDADIAFHNVGVEGFPFLAAETRGMSLDLCVPDPGGRYMLSLDLFDTDGGILKVRCDSPGSAWEECPVRPHGKITVRGVTADPSGRARILFERKDGPAVDVTFRSLCLTEDK